MLPDQKLEALITRHAALQRDLSGVLPPETYVKLSREFAELTPVVDAVKSYRDAQRELDGLIGLIADPSTNSEMRSIAAAEKPELEAQHATLEQELRLALLPKDAMDERNVILEIRAGTGGDEAALFAGDLFRMLQRYAAGQGWKVEMVTASDGPMGGYKEIIAEIRGRGAFAKLKFESGVHRVQRVPDTEGSGRIHTSTATVAVLPEAEELDLAINDGDLRDRHAAVGRRRGPACQQDQIRRPRDASPHRNCRHDAGGPLAASQSFKGDGRAADAALRLRAAKGGRGAGR